MVISSLSYAMAIENALLLVLKKIRTNSERPKAIAVKSLKMAKYILISVALE